MNVYLLFLLIYAATIVPLRLDFRLRLGKKSGYRVELRAAGLPFRRAKGPEEREGERPLSRQSGARFLLSADAALMRALLDRRLWKRCLRLLRLRRLSLFARFSFSSAGATALSFCLFRTAIETLRTAGALPSAFQARLEADFSCAGSEALAEGIAVLRLGSLIPAAAALLAAYWKYRRRETDINGLERS